MKHSMKNYEQKAFSDLMAEFTVKLNAAFKEGVEQGKTGWDQEDFWVSNPWEDRMRKELNEGRFVDLALMAMFQWNRQQKKR